MDWQTVIEAAWTLLAVFITCVCIPFLKQKLTEAQYGDLEFFVKMAVQWAEQKYKDKEKMGSLKKEEVYAFLEKLGLVDKFDNEIIDKKIEAEVYALSQ